MIEKIKNKFYNYCVKHLPQGTHTRTEVWKSDRFGGGWEINLYELEINVYCNDLDGYDCPPSKIRNQII